MAQQMPLPLTDSYRLTWVVPEKGSLNECVCVCRCGIWWFSMTQYVTQTTQQHAMPHYAWRNNHSLRRDWLQQLCLVNTDACKKTPGTTQVSRYQKGKAIWILLKQETVSGSGIRWAICKSAPSSSQITMPAPHHSVFYGPDALPVTQPTTSKHWRQWCLQKTCTNILFYFRMSAQ